MTNPTPPTAIPYADLRELLAKATRTLNPNPLCATCQGTGKENDSTGSGYTTDCGCMSHQKDIRSSAIGAIKRLLLEHAAALIENSEQAERMKGSSLIETVNTLTAERDAANERCQRAEKEMDDAREERDAVQDLYDKQLSLTKELRLRAAYAESRSDEMAKWEPKLLPSDFPTEMRIACAHDAMKNMVLAFDALNCDANYTETDIKCGETCYFVTVRRGDKPTDHQLRMKAEYALDAANRRVGELEEAVKVLGEYLTYMESPPGDEYSAAECEHMIDAVRDNAIAKPFLDIARTALTAKEGSDGTH